MEYAGAPPSTKKNASIHEFSTPHQYLSTPRPLPNPKTRLSRVQSVRWRDGCTLARSTTLWNYALSTYLGAAFLEPSHVPAIFCSLSFHSLRKNGG